MSLPPPETAAKGQRGPDAPAPFVSALFWDARILRRFWLDALSHAMDGYLRSTAFLEFMQQSLRMVSSTANSVTHPSESWLRETPRR
jgi:hypothetical protein